MPNTDLTIFIKSKLNKPQQEVVHAVGATLVIAGAGSGKTRVITTRIAQLIASGITPNSILALTFTNKAAQEMKERIKQFVGVQKLPFVGTFHSYCVQLLRKYSSLIDCNFKTILDEDDQRKLLQTILKKHNLHKQFSPRTVSYSISHLKNHTTNPEKKAHDYIHHPLIVDIFHEYETEKKASHSLDFDDLLLKAVELFKKHSFKEQFQAVTRHILVDEYQDTNVVQHALLKHMALQQKKLAIDSICVVGDEDQSIYSWRGATIDNMLNFQKDFEGTKIIKIEQNYRSVQPILNIANHVIEHNTKRNAKSLWSEKKGRDRIRLLNCLSEYQESYVIMQTVKAAHAKYPDQEVAVLYRTHAQSRAIEEMLIKYSVPYKIIGGVQFYERKEVKDTLAYLRLIVNPFDRASFWRVLNVPTRGFGAKFEEQIIALWEKEPFLSFTQVLQKMTDSITPTKAKAIKEFCTIFETMTETQSPSKAIESIVQKTAYFAYLRNSYERPEAESRIENIRELIEAAHHFEKQGINTVELFLDEVALMQDKLAKQDDTQKRVLLMTLHAAKGLEFDTVIMPGLEEGILPSTRSIEDDKALEEERRLLYVGITRAKERLLILHSNYRYTYGQMVDQFPSRFLEEIPSNLIKMDTIVRTKEHEIPSYFQQWFGITPITTIASEQKNKVLKSTFKTTEKKSPLKSSAWQANQPVQHPKYGVGIIQKCDKRPDDTFLTIRFKIGIKKISAKFIQKI